MAASSNNTPAVIVTKTCIKLSSVYVIFPRPEEAIALLAAKKSTDKSTEGMIVLMRRLSQFVSAVPESHKEIVFKDGTVVKLGVETVVNERRNVVLKDTTYAREGLMQDLKDFAHNSFYNLISSFCIVKLDEKVGAELTSVLKSALSEITALSAD